MKILDKLKLRRFAKVAAIAAVGGTLLFGGVNVADASPAGLQAFREAYTAQAPDTRIFNQNLTLIAPTFHLDIDSKAQVTADGVMRMSGDLAWTYTNLKKNYSVNNNIPFYIEQIGDNEMSLYVNRRGSWSKMFLPGLPAAIAGIWKTTNSAILNDNMDAVKNVEIINDTPAMRVMQVTLDGKKLAAILEKNSNNSFAHLSGYRLTEQQENFKRWLTAVGAQDIEFTWAVSKDDRRTITSTFDLTDIMRAYSRYVLEEAAAGRVVLTPEERDLLDAMGYYSELKSYTSSVAPNADVEIEIPADLLTAPENDNSLDDIFYEMTTVIKK